jgi:hypothetical protein
MGAGASAKAYPTYRFTDGPPWLTLARFRERPKVPHEIRGLLGDRASQCCRYVFIMPKKALGLSSPLADGVDFNKIAAPVARVPAACRIRTDRWSISRSWLT